VKTNTAAENQWVAVDLHVHTPASKDYEGPKEDNEFVALLRRANEFEKSTTQKKLFKSIVKPVSCVAFTDHNSIDGFRKWKSIYDKSASLAEAIRDRDPSNPLLKELNADLDSLKSVRVLMGAEVKAYPGVHLLIIWHESVQPETAEKFLSDAYSKPYSQINGDPEPTTTLTIGQLLDLVNTTFGQNAMVVAPHVESGGGLFECTKELPQVRISALIHGALRAISFNKAETREKISNLLLQPEYRRSEPIAYIQASDSHGTRGVIGHPRTEVHVPNGRPTFSSIRQAFCHSIRVKCSVDLLEQEYKALTGNQPVAHFVSLGELAFSDQDTSRLCRFVCASLNSGKGVVELEANGISDQEVRKYPEQINKQFRDLVNREIEPAMRGTFSRLLTFSSSRVKLLLKPDGGKRVFTSGGFVYIHDDTGPRPAKSFEIEAIVARNIDSQFGERFSDTLDDTAQNAILLAKMPSAIPLLLKCRPQLSFLTRKRLSATKLQTVSAKGREADDDAQEIMQGSYEEHTFGVSKGNCAFLPRRPAAPREREHYYRFSAFQALLPEGTVERLSNKRFDKPTIIVAAGGAVVLVGAMPVITTMAAFSLGVPEELEPHLVGVFAWLKSSFFVWYCAVHLGDPDFYKLLLDPTNTFPIPHFAGNEEFYRRMASMAQNIVLEERKFLEEIERLTKRGLDKSTREKMRVRHNSVANGMCLSIDKEVAEFLALSPDDRESIASTLQKIGLSDFGYLEVSEQENESDDKAGA
jgi:hypothetical protein